jgi:hypothetical protein
MLSKDSFDIFFHIPKLYYFVFFISVLNDPSVLSKNKILEKKFETYPMLHIYAIWVVYGYYIDDIY